MIFDAFYEHIYRLGVVPVVVLNRVEDAAPLAHALVAGGLPAAEVTFRTPVAAECIAAMRAAEPDLCLGAGTVLSVSDIGRTLEAGGTFVVSPGFDAAVVRHCLDLEIPVLPAGVTPTEIMAIRAMGIIVSKFFPADIFGGLAAIEALAAPLVGHRFMPTGGVTLQNLSQYLASPHVVACGGTWMVKGDLIEAGRFDEVERLVRETVSVVQSVRKPV